MEVTIRLETPSRFGSIQPVGTRVNWRKKVFIAVCNGVMQQYAAGDWRVRGGSVIVSAAEVRDHSDIRP